MILLVCKSNSLDQIIICCMTFVSYLNVVFDIVSHGIYKIAICTVVQCHGSHTHARAHTIYKYILYTL